MNNNYFKAVSKTGRLVDIVFFDDTSLYFTRDAFERIRFRKCKIVMYRVPPVRGPWDKCDVVGYRSVDAICRDMDIIMGGKSRNEYQLSLAESEEMKKLTTELFERKALLVRPGADNEAA